MQSIEVRVKVTDDSGSYVTKEVVAVEAKRTCQDADKVQRVAAGLIDDVADQVAVQFRERRKLAEAQENAVETA